MGYVYALLAAVLFGANGSLTKLILETDLSATQLTLLRTLGIAISAGVALLVVDRNGFRIGWRRVGIMAILGVFGLALLQAGYAAAIALLPVGIALLLEYLAVLFVALVAFFVFHEKVRRRLWIAIALVLAGLALVAQIWASTLNALGVLFGLGAAASLTIYFVVGERQVSRTSPLAVAFWTGTFATAFWARFSGWWELDAGIFVQPTELAGVHGSLELPLWMPLIVTAIAGSFVTFLLSFTALKYLTATAAGVVASSEVLFAFLFAWLWLGETLDTIQLLGAGVVLVGIVLAQTARAAKTVVAADLALPPSTASIPTVGGPL